ncbi:hypothetical protein T484DRAFT_1965969 [Baffinella frigidus]|nr:hypothetical protein T484DRAFT_1965969 [Cryptophyta sp. CCMP2293]
MIIAWCPRAAFQPPPFLTRGPAPPRPGLNPFASRFSLRRARRVPHFVLMVVVVGVVGCSGSGKSTLCTALADALGGEVVNGDDFFLEDSHLEALDLSALPWPGEGIPAALANKRTDTNVPSAIDWGAFEAAVDEARSNAIERDQELLFVDSFMLLSGAGRDGVAGKVDRFILLEHASAPPELLLERKWGRARPGGASYKDRGVTEEEYKVYLDGYVLARFSALEQARFLPPGTRSITLPCERGLAQLVREARSFLGMDAAA